MKFSSVGNPREWGEGGGGVLTLLWSAPLRSVERLRAAAATAVLLQNESKEQPGRLSMRKLKIFWLCSSPGKHIFHAGALKHLISLLSSWTSLKIHSWGKVWDPPSVVFFMYFFLFSSSLSFPPLHRGSQPTIGASQWKNSVSSPCPVGPSGNNIHYSR